ncbi:MAG TPA: hypothetical protein VNO30_45355 [Kofleriaceae bacterium]|nr:hypothetical protein [Kofleriaceae bacterium]
MSQEDEGRTVLRPGGPRPRPRPAGRAGGGPLAPPGRAAAGCTRGRDPLAPPGACRGGLHTWARLGGLSAASFVVTVIWVQIQARPAAPAASAPAPATAVKAAPVAPAVPAVPPRRRAAARECALEILRASLREAEPAARAARAEALAREQDGDGAVRIAAAAATVAIAGLEPQVLAGAAVDVARRALDSQDAAARRTAASCGRADLPESEALPLLARAIADRDRAAPAPAHRRSGPGRAARGRRRDRERRAEGQGAGEAALPAARLIRSCTRRRRAS